MAAKKRDDQNDVPAIPIVREEPEEHEHDTDSCDCAHDFHGPALTDLIQIGAGLFDVLAHNDHREHATRVADRIADLFDYLTDDFIPDGYFEAREHMLRAPVEIPNAFRDAWGDPD